MSIASGQHDQRPPFWHGVARLWRFDLQRFRVPIAVVGGLELLRGAVAEWALHGARFGSQGPIEGDTAAFEFQSVDGALRIATAIVTAIVVQADHPTDDRGFLRSRPVGAWEVAVAKVTLLATLLVVLPFLVTSARLLAYDAPATSLVASAVQFAVMGGSLALPAWALALSTRTLPRFMAAVAGLVVAWSVASAAILSYGLWGLVDDRLMFRARQGFTEFAAPLADWQHAEARGWLFALAMTIAAAAILMTYYRSRRVIAAATAALGLVLIPAVTPAWDAESPVSPDLAAVIDGDVRLDALVVPSARAVAQIAASGRWREAMVSGTITVPMLPLNMSTEREIGDVRVSAPGLRIVQPGRPYCCDNADVRASAAAAGAPVDDPSIWDGPGPPGEGGLFLAPFAQIEALRGRRVDVDADIGLHLTRYVLVADIPLRAGAAVRTSDTLIEVVAVDDATKDIRCRFTRFPTLARSRPRLWTFIDHPQTGIVRSLGLREQDRGFRAEGLGWARGRTWSRLVRLPMLHLPAAPPAPRLRVVESRPAGEMRTRLVARDIPVWTAELHATVEPRIE